MTPIKNYRESIVTTMSSRKSQFMPERISELLCPSKSSDKRLTCGKSRLEPVKIKELLESASKVRPSSVEKSSGNAFAIPRKPVRRALYIKPSPKPSPTKSTSSQSSTESKIPSKSEKKIVKARKSLLPQPNSIAQRYIQKAQTCSIIEERPSEVEKTSPQIHQQRPTVIRSTAKKSLTFKENVEVNPIVDDPADSNEKLNDDLEASIADKENIPPLREHVFQPLKEMSCLYDIELQQLEMYSYFKSRMDKIEQNQSVIMERLEYNQSVLMDAMEKMFNLMTTFIETSRPISVPDVSSTPRIEVSLSSPKDDKENLTSDKKKRRSKIADGEKRRSLRLAAHSTEKNDSFLLLENQLHINHLKSPSTKVSSASATPKNIKRSSIKPKSDRPLREYLALKASIPFLETPDHTGFKKKLQIINDTPSMQRSMRRSISTKLYDELRDLYNDSIEGSTVD